MTDTRNAELDLALRQMETAAINFAYRFHNIAQVRSRYIQEVQSVSENLRRAAERGEMSAKAAAEAAHGIRNQILEHARAQSADLGKALAQQLKAKGVDLDTVLDKVAKQRFGKSFGQLDNAQQTSAYLDVVDSAGRPRGSANRFAARAGAAGRALFILGIGIAIYNIGSADDPVWQTGREASSLGGGFAGGAAGGALAGIWCGPVGVAIGALVGGVAGALLGDTVYVEAAGPQGEFAKSFLPRFTSVLSTDEEGIATALYNECGINMDQVFAIFRELDTSYSTDADDVAEAYLNRVFLHGGSVSHALSMHAQLRQLLVSILEGGYTDSSQQMLITKLSAL